MSRINTTVKLFSDQADKVSELIRNGADVNARMGTETPLLIAMENGNTKLARNSVKLKLNQSNDLLFCRP